MLAALLLLAMEPESMPAASQPASVPSSVPGGGELGPIRFGLWLGPVVPTAFRTEKIAGAGQLGMEYWFNPYVGIKAAVGLGAGSTAFFMTDAGAVFDFLADGVVIPYAEATVGLFGWLNNAVFPESSEGRAVVSFAPAVGAGIRLFKTATNYALGVHYRLLVDGTNAQNPSRIHGMVEIRLALSFR